MYRIGSGVECLYLVFHLQSRWVFFSLVLSASLMETIPHCLLNATRADDVQQQGSQREREKHKGQNVGAASGTRNSVPSVSAFCLFKTNLSSWQPIRKHRNRATLPYFFFFKFLSVEFIIWKWIKVDCNSRIEIGAFSLFQGRARALFHIPCNRIKGLIKQPITCVSHSLVRRCSHYGELTEAMPGGVGGGYRSHVSWTN